MQALSLLKLRARPSGELTDHEADYVALSQRAKEGSNRNIRLALVKSKRICEIVNDIADGILAVAVLDDERPEFVQSDAAMPISVRKRRCGLRPIPLARPTPRRDESKARHPGRPRRPSPPAPSMPDILLREPSTSSPP